MIHISIPAIKHILHSCLALSQQASGNIVAEKSCSERKIPPAPCVVIKSNVKSKVFLSSLTSSVVFVSNSLLNETFRFIASEYLALDAVVIASIFLWLFLAECRGLPFLRRSAMQSTRQDFGCRRAKNEIKLSFFNDSSMNAAAFGLPSSG